MNKTGNNKGSDKKAIRNCKNKLENIYDDQNIALESTWQKSEDFR
jgi:hypothetical protein